MNAGIIIKNDAEIIVNGTVLVKIHTAFIMPMKQYVSPML